jgi:hypothetical protein
MRYSTVRAATVACVTVTSLTPSAIAGQGARPAVPHAPPVRTTAWAPTRTPWGDPDLQGGYTNYHELNVPFERPARFEGRSLNDISEQELAEFTQELNQKRRQSVEANIFRPLWNGKNFDLKNSRAWLVVDPQNGKVPPLTPSAQERDAANVARRNRPPADSVADLNLWYRCITRGLPGSMIAVGRRAAVHDRAGSRRCHDQLRDDSRDSRHPLRRPSPRRIEHPDVHG